MKVEVGEGVDKCGGGEDAVEPVDDGRDDPPWGVLRGVCPNNVFVDIHVVIPVLPEVGGGQLLLFLGGDAQGSGVAARPWKI